ncbi:MAG: hypothetical protein K0R65_1141 [Crocinitomicaceae bacterium]|nr:hypothetical protein [Crocinitomicaceae bacterium]
MRISDEWIISPETAQILFRGYRFDLLYCQLFFSTICGKQKNHLPCDRWFFYSCFLVFIIFLRGLGSFLSGLLPVLSQELWPAFLPVYCHRLSVLACLGLSHLF